MTSHRMLWAMLAACSGPPSETTTETSQAVDGAFNDLDTPEANVVVDLNGGGCTGTLITPQIVLTASHCINKEPTCTAVLPRINIGAYAGSLSYLRSNRYPVSADTRIVGCSAQTEFGIDMALLYLAPTSAVLDEANIERPSLTSPSPGGSDSNGGDYGSIGMAGWSHMSSVLYRQAVLFTVVTLDHLPGHPDAPSGQYWLREQGNVQNQPGDSGGPLFVRRPDGTRDPIGVLHGTAWDLEECGFYACDVWTDITRGYNAQWIRDKVLDSAHGGHTAAWRARHGKAADFWYGEVDYTGPCDLTRDHDCDHWYDEHDNCPDDPNPDQLDTDDDGVGDACLAPTISSVYPSNGPPRGGTSVRIDGTHFDTGGKTTVTFGGQPSFSVSCPSTTQCNATTPPGNGIADVVVTHGLHSSPVPATAKFYYVPSVTGIEPATAKVGDVVTIHGVGFSWQPGATTIRFGSSLATASCYPGPDCTALVPAGAGTVDVIATVGGTATTPWDRDKFTYVASGITSIGTTSGSIAGGTYLDIYGNGFDPDTATTHQMHVYFGNVESDFVNCMTSTWCYVRSPASVTGYGHVHVWFTSFGETSPQTSNDLFDYVPAAVASIAWYWPTGSVSLNGYAPAGGVNISFASSDPSGVVPPAPLWIAPGVGGSTFGLTLPPIDHSETVTLTASDGVASVSTTVAVTAWPAFSLQLATEVLATNGSSTATVSLATAAPAGGALVSLVSSDPAAIPVPASVTIAAGSHQAIVPITNHYAGAPKAVTLTASYAGNSSSGSISVPRAIVCTPHKCPTGWWWHPDDCACEFGLPN